MYQEQKNTFGCLKLILMLIGVLILFAVVIVGVSVGLDYFTNIGT